jgi:hypothetical protein
VSVEDHAIIGIYPSESWKKISQAWEQFFLELTAFSSGTNLPSLRDDLDAILEAIANDVERPQGPGEQADKSKGKGRGLRALDQSTDQHTSMRLNEAGLPKRS